MTINTNGLSMFILIVVSTIVVVVSLPRPRKNSDKGLVALDVALDVVLVRYHIETEGICPL